MTDITTFDKIVQALDLNSMPLEDQEKVLSKLSELIFRGTMVRLYERMDDATRADFTALLERQASPEEVDTFLKERVPGAEKAAEEAVAALADDILSVTSST